MKDGERVQVLPDIVLVRRENQVLKKLIISLECDLDVKTRLLKCYRADVARLKQELEDVQEEFINFQEQF